MNTWLIPMRYYGPQRNAKKLALTRPEITARYRARHPERARACVDRYQAKNRDKVHASTRRWQSNNPEKVRAYRIQYAQENVDRLNALRDKWKTANPEKHRAAINNWEQHNRDKVRSAALRWIKANKPACAAAQARRRARKLCATPVWLTEANHIAMKSLYAEAARLTKQCGEDFHVDHIVPLRGRTVCGLHVPWNLQILRGVENMSKNNREVF